MVNTIPDETWRPALVQMETNFGKFTIELYWNHAPMACRNFAELARRGYYDNCSFHRLIPNFVIQGGDPTGTGRGGESIYGHYFEDEICSELKHTGAGIVSMASAQPNVNGSQFLITLAPTKSLDSKFTIFGRIASGMATIRKMAQVESDRNHIPTEAITIRKACVIESV